MNIIIYPNSNKINLGYEETWTEFNYFKNSKFILKKDTEIDTIEKTFNKELKNIKNIFIFKCDYCKFIAKNINFILNNQNITFYILEGDHHYLSSKPDTWNRYMLLRSNLIENNHIKILSPYWYHYKLLYKINKNNLIPFPVPVLNYNILKINNNPINKILLSGSISKHYPARKYLKSLNNENVKLLKRTKTQTEYYKVINNYICTFACCLNKNTPYIIGKFYEIPATGSLLLAYDEFVKEPLKKLGFIENVNYISCDLNNIIDKIEWICNLENRDEINKIRKAGQELILNKHTFKQRFELIKNLVI